MAFSFNWQGLTVPEVKYFDAVRDQNVGTNLGKAARGYENRKAAKEYADKIRDYRMGRSASQNTDASRIEAIKNEIAALKEQNAKMAAQLQGSSAELSPADATAQLADSIRTNNNVSSAQLYDELLASNFDPAGATVDEIKAMQTKIGATPDGIWGPKSQAAFDANYGYLFQ